MGYYVNIDLVLSVESFFVVYQWCGAIYVLFFFCRVDQLIEISR